MAVNPNWDSRLTGNLQSIDSITGRAMREYAAYQTRRVALLARLADAAGTALVAVLEARSRIEADDRGALAWLRVEFRKARRHVDQVERIFREVVAATPRTVPAEDLSRVQGQLDRAVAAAHRAVELAQPLMDAIREIVDRYGHGTSGEAA